jgi:hypothetical protein
LPHVLPIATLTKALNIFLGPYIFMQFSLLLFLLALISHMFACVLENKANETSYSENAEEEEFRSPDKCYEDSDCQIYNQDCCFEESGLIVILKSKLKENNNKTTKECNEKLKSSPNLCQDKKRVALKNYPKAACDKDKGQCILIGKKQEPGASVLCASDNECELFNPDCCNNPAKLTAINIQAGQDEREKKLNTCMQEPNKCKNKPASSDKFKKAMCEDKKCVVK